MCRPGWWRRTCGPSSPPAPPPAASSLITDPVQCTLLAQYKSDRLTFSIFISLRDIHVLVVHEVQQLDGLVGQQVVDQLALLPRLSRYWKIEEVNKYRSVQELRSSSKLFMFF